MSTPKRPRGAPVVARAVAVPMGPETAFRVGEGVLLRQGKDYGGPGGERDAACVRLRSGDTSITLGRATAGGLAVLLARFCYSGNINPSAEDSDAELRRILEVLRYEPRTKNGAAGPPASLPEEAVSAIVAAVLPYMLELDGDATAPESLPWEPGGCPGKGGRCVHSPDHFGGCESVEERNAREAAASLGADAIRDALTGGAPEIVTLTEPLPPGWLEEIRAAERARRGDV